MSSRSLLFLRGLLFAAVAACALAACGGSSSSSTSKSTTTTIANASATNTSGQHYIWVAANITDPFYVQGLEGWHTAAKALGVQASLIGPPTADVQAQVSDINTAIANHSTAGLLVYPIDYTTLGPVLKKAVAAGIPVILGNGDSTDKSVRTAFVGTDNVQFGQTAGALVGSLLHGTGTVGIVSQLALNHVQRRQGFAQELAAKYPGIHVAAVVTSDGSPTGEERAATGLLQGHPGLNAIWTTDAGSGTVARAISLAGKAGKLIVVGSDRSPEELAAVKDGTVAATVVQDTYAEEFLSLYELYWLHNHLVNVPDTIIDRAFPVTKSTLSALDTLK